MKIGDISKPLTADRLNESLAKKFGQKVDFNKFTLEQLQDVRNKVRTSLSQVETHESFDAVHSETYQKSKALLDVLNAAIAERSESPIEEKAVSKDQQRAAGIALKHKREGTKPQKGSASEEMMKMSTKELEKFAGTEHKGLPEKKSKKESVVREGAEDQAEITMAAKDMVDRLTGWMEDTAEMQTESMLELADAIRDELGAEQSESFTALVKPGLEALYAAMEETRTVLTQGVGMLTGEGEAPEAMGADDEMPVDEPEMEPTVDAEAGAEADVAVGGVEDEFGAADAAAGGEEEAGRAKRESVERSRKIGQILSKKK
jgi:predicted CopG family antitoxin